MRVVGDRYRLGDRIGSGGAGTVWRAHDTLLERTVAVKEVVWSPGQAEASRERALREARSAARLQHPAVVQVFDVVEDDDRAWLVMELVDAPSLAQMVREQGPLSPASAARIGLEVVSALVAAHDAGIVHRDVKPSNVLVGSDRTRLTDFGIVSMADDPGLTATGVVLGTPAFLSPEQARGSGVGPGADLYGLGATLYFAVEGVGPFSGQGTMATVLAVVNSEPRPMANAGPLRETIAGLLSKNPEDRPDSTDLGERLAKVARADAPAQAATTPRAGAAPTDREGGGQGRVVDVRPAADVTPASQATAETRRGRPGRVVASVAAVALLLLAVAAAAGALGGGDGSQGVATPGEDVGVANPASPAPGGAVATPTPTAEATASAEPGAVVTPPPTPATEPTPQVTVTEEPAPPKEPPTEELPTEEAPTEEPPTAPTGGQNGVLPDLDVAVPADWQSYQPEAAPYALRFPPGWNVERRAERRVDLTDPDTGTFLRLEWNAVDQDPLVNWQNLSADFTEPYEERRIVRTQFRGDQAALWEYVYTRGGTTRHALDLGINHNGAYGLAVNLQAPEDQWDAALQLWAPFLSSLQLESTPPG